MGNQINDIKIEGPVADQDTSIFDDMPEAPIDIGRVVRELKNLVESDFQFSSINWIFIALISLVLITVVIGVYIAKYRSGNDTMSNWLEDFYNWPLFNSLVDVIQDKFNSLVAPFTD